MVVLFGKGIVILGSIILESHIFRWVLKSVLIIHKLDCSCVWVSFLIDS